MATKKTHAKDTTAMLFEFLVLSGMKRSGWEFVDVQTIVHAIRRYAQIDLQIGTVYVVLRRLEERMLVFRTEERRPHGESRHFYTPYPAGNEYHVQLLGRLLTLAN